MVYSSLMMWWSGLAGTAHWHGQSPESSWRSRWVSLSGHFDNVGFYGRSACRCVRPGERSGDRCENYVWHILADWHQLREKNLWEGREAGQAQNGCSWVLGRVFWIVSSLFNPGQSQKVFKVWMMVLMLVCWCFLLQKGTLNLAEGCTWLHSTKASDLPAGTPQHSQIPT